MIAYNTDWLNNLMVQEEADKALEDNCISKEEKANIDTAHPVGFYTPNPFVRIGLFILTCVIAMFSLGLIGMLFLSSGNEKTIGGMFLFFGMIIYAALEVMVSKKHYRSGVDDALLWMAAGCIVGGLNALADISTLANALIIFVLALFLFLRFTDALMAGISSLALLAIIFLTVIKFGPLAKAITPFIIMLSAGGIYFFVQQLLQNNKWKHYGNGLLLVSVISLVCLYAAGNYFVVREASIAMFDLDIKPGENIALGWLFWIFTIAIPIFYIIRGIQKKDAVLLRTGLLLIAAIVFTVRYYYHILPAETAMVAGGILFIAIAYGLIKYLQEPKFGFTYKEQNDKFFMDKLNAESLVIAQTFSGPQPAGTNGGTQFGGGSGGGGGATGEF